MNNEEIRIQKLLASRGIGSRRQIESWIREGRIIVNGKEATIGQKIKYTDKLIVDGEKINVKPKEIKTKILIYNKPEGEVCTRKDDKGRPTVFDSLPGVDSRWVMVGRLDINTSGLLLFTNNGELAQYLMHPSNQIEREYKVRVFGKVDKSHLKRLEQGVVLDDGQTAIAKKAQKIQDSGGLNSWFKIILTEGKNREIRRMWEALGFTVSRLIRVRYNDISLPRELKLGAYKIIKTDIKN